MRSDIEANILAAFGSFESPNFRVVAQRLSANPHHALLAQLEKRWPIWDMTDLNEDRGYRLNIDNARLMLRTSLVGPYALLMRSDPDRFTVVDDDNATSEEGEILSLVRAHGLEPLPLAIVNEEIQLGNLFNAEGTPVAFHALFADTDNLPWNKGGYG